MHSRGSFWGETVRAASNSLTRRATVSARAGGQAVRHASSFATEEQLVSTIRAVFGQTISPSWKWIREFNSSSGIADLVAVALCRGWQQQASMRLVPARWLYPLKCLPFGVPIDLKSFATRFGVSESCAQSVLATYAEAAYCAYEAEQRVWTKARDPHPVAERIVALEAKLRDWRRALYQAVQYASYAFETWVVLDRDSLHSASIHIDEFEKRGIGLMGLSVSGLCEIVSPAASRPPRNHERFWQANAEIIRRILT